MAGPATTPIEDYSQPALPTPKPGGWYFNIFDMQVTSKSSGWNPTAAALRNEIKEFLKVSPNVTHVAIAVPYDNVSKMTTFVTAIRAMNLKVCFRSHHDNWEGDNSAAADLSSAAYLNQTYDFIVANSTLYKEGDMFATCVEAANANSTPNTTYPFRTGNVVGGGFNSTLYNRFQRDQVTYANAAFQAIGLGGKIHTWAISQSVSFLNLNGEVLYGTNGSNGDAGNASGFGNADIVQYFAGRLSIDHYESNSIRDANTYFTAYDADLDHFHTAFPSCKIMISEFGYHTTVVVPDGEQYGVFDRILKSLRTKSFIIGFSAWVHMGSSTASLWNDNGGAVVVGGRKVVHAIEAAFNAGNATINSRDRIIRNYGKSIHFSGSGTDQVNFGNVTIPSTCSFAIWVRLDDVHQSGSAFQNFIRKDTPIIIDWNSNGKLEFAVNDGGGYDAMFSSKASWAANTWWHIVFTTERKIYVNGVLDNTGTNKVPLNSSANLFLGFTSSSSLNKFYDDLMFFSRALTAAEVAALYLQGPPPTGLTNQWKFDEDVATTAYDFVGASDGTITGAAHADTIPNAVRDVATNRTAV